MISLEKGETLVKLARKTIETYLEDGKKPELSDDYGEDFKEDRGVFVTLKKKEELRGCIGRPLPTQTLLQGVMDSAISAATGDPRFPSLDIEELDEVTIEVSVLTPPEEVKYESPKDCVSKIEVGRDGLIVKSERREGLLLPQVPVEHGWGAEEFLSQTCLKAGLSRSCWEGKDVELKKFSGQVFSEEEPKGEVVEKDLPG